MGWKKAHVKRTLLKMQTKKKKQYTKFEWTKIVVSIRGICAHEEQQCGVWKRATEKKRVFLQRNTSDSRVKSNAITYEDGKREEKKTAQLILLCIARSFGFFSLLFCLLYVFASSSNFCHRHISIVWILCMVKATTTSTTTLAPIYLYKYTK